MQSILERVSVLDQQNRYEVMITDLDHEGRGVGRLENGKAVFVEGALPTERVLLKIKKESHRFSIGKLLRVIEPSGDRVKPKCQHFGTCGGCALQHLAPEAQVAIKQRSLEQTLLRLGSVRPDVLLSPLYGESWGYRYRARLSVWYHPSWDRVLIGFRHKHSAIVLGLKECPVLQASFSKLLPALEQLVYGLSIRNRIPQLEVAIPSLSAVSARIVLVLRILDPLSETDQQALQQFADAHAIQWWLQPKGAETAYPFYPLPAPDRLAYELPDFDLQYDFFPVEFTQVNAPMNQVMVRRAIEALKPKAGEFIIDFFCGLGNFTLPLARSGANVLGLEGSSALVERARENAQKQGLEHRARFDCMDLFKVDEAVLASWGTPSAILLDPPRDGAMELVKALPNQGYNRIVYVSCNPATLARDAGILVNEKGYTLVAAGIMNMFPHTTHIESMAIFQREG